MDLRQLQAIEIAEEGLRRATVMRAATYKGSSDRMTRWEKILKWAQSGNPDCINHLLKHRLSEFEEQWDSEREQVMI